MNTLLLIALNLFFVPFLQEAEAQGRRLLRFPGPLRILRLAHVRRLHWLKPFCALAVLLLAAVLASARNRPVDGLTLIVHLTIIQTILWTVVALSVRKHAGVRARGVMQFGPERFSRG